MRYLVDAFIGRVIACNAFQKKSIGTLELTDGEKEELNKLLVFLTEQYNGGCDLEYIVEAYLFINNMVMEETYFFMTNGRYRYSKLEEVDKIVYDNPEYMEKYMLGLIVSQYLWINHVKMVRFFEKWLGTVKGKHYLEIGPGFGQYLIKSIAQCNFEKYEACDLSLTSVNGSNQYLEYLGVEKKCRVEHKNFFDYTSDEKFDCIVMGEVLEHVEEPLVMLKKMYELLSENGKAFVTTAINAPTLDHIYLFSNIEEVLDMVREAGFEVDDYTCIASGDIAIDKALKQKKAITIAVALRKNKII